MHDQILREESVFLDALEKAPGPERQQFLEGACGQDRHLRDAVDRLLREHDKTGDLLGHVDGASVSIRSVTQSPLSLDDRIGPYQIRELLGEGGFGVVYVAEQSEPVKRKVALKVIKPGMDTREVIARFEAERQALAMMDHPNVAKIFDAGETEKGLPYFVMELFKGVSITDFCDSQRLPTRERLQLLIDVCRAVQHAHQKGIIHRDLKPSNVMVSMHDDTPVVKVIDFGVSKALDQKLTEKTLYTSYHQMLGTPMYMSPEQAQMSGLDIDTRSDVYSLGVLAYEVITGTTPFDRETFRTADFDELRRIIREDNPVRPSDRLSTLQLGELSTVCDKRQVDQRQLRQILAGELDWIVMKALEKDRSRRYESVAALAGDFQRYLDGQPVLACPPSAVYRFRKYAGRHKGLFTAVGLMTATLMIATGVSLWYAFQAGEARQQADHEKGNAVAAKEKSDENFAAALDAIDKLLQHASSEELAELPQSQSIRKEILEDVLDFYSQFQLTTGDSPQLRYRAALTWSNLAWLSRDLAQFEQAVKALEQTLTYMGQLVEEYPANAEYQLPYLTSLFGLAQLTYMPKIGDFDAAARYLTRAANNLDKLLKNHPERAEDWLSLKVRWHERMSKYSEKMGDTDGQIRFAVAGYELSETLDSLSSWDVAQATQVLARALEKSDPDRALELYQKAIDVSRFPDHTDGKRRWVHSRVIWLNRAFDLAVTRNTELAFNYVQESLESTTYLVSEFPSLTLYQSRMDDCNRRFSTLLDISSLDLDARLGFVHRLVKQFPELVQLHDARARLLYESEDPIVELIQAIEEYPDVGAYHHRRSSAYADQGKASLAMEDLERAIANYARLPESQQPSANVFKAHAEELAKRKRFELAIANYDRFVELSDKPSNAFFDRGEFYLYKAKDYQRALADLDRAIQIRQPGHWFKRRALAHFHLGNYDAALEDLKRPEVDPKDGSRFYWIPPELVAACPDESFRDGMLRFAESAVKQHNTADNHFGRGVLLEGFARDDEALAEFSLAVEMEPEIYYLRKGPAGIHLVRRQFDKALIDLTKMIEMRPNERSTYSVAALVYATTGQHQKYSGMCQKMLGRPFARLNKKNASEVHYVAWACALAPGAVNDYEPPIKLAQYAVDLNADNRQCLVGLGAILLRAGQLEAAKETLIKSLALPADEATSPAYVHYFLALTEHYLGNQQEAVLQLRQANQLADEELSEDAKGSRKQTLELLRQEAEALIDTD